MTLVKLSIRIYYRDQEVTDRLTYKRSEWRNGYSFERQENEGIGSHFGGFLHSFTPLKSSVPCMSHTFLDYSSFKPRDSLSCEKQLSCLEHGANKGSKSDMILVGWLL